MAIPPRTKSITAWSPGPNRHVEPIWDAALRRGVLDHVYYESDSLPGWTQRGTRPTLAPSRRRHLLSRTLSDEEIAGLVRAGTWNLVATLGPLGRRVVRICAREHVPVFLLLESLQRRSRWSPRRIVRDAIYRQVLRSASGVFALSRSAAVDYARLGAERHRILPGMYCGPDTSLPFEPKTDPSLIYCGRLVPDKSVDLLLDAVRQMVPRVPNLQLHIVGNGPEMKRLCRTGKDLPVVFHGSVSTAAALELIRQSAVLVLPTRRWEGWGYVVNEALALGTPVVVSDRVASRELVAPGATGYIFREGDVDDMSKAIDCALALHLDPKRVGEAFRRVQPVLSSDVCLNYMISSAEHVLTGAVSQVTAPWLLATAAFGGVDAQWWKDWGKLV